MDWQSAISYPPIIPLLERLLDGARSVLSERFLGLYLSGSLAAGDFVPYRSDVDFVVATTEPLPAGLLPALAFMHQRLTASGLAFADHLEGSYIPRQALRRYDPAYAHYPSLRVDGSFAVDHHASDWIIQLHLLRERGIPMAGPHPRTLVDPVPPENMRQAVRGILSEWWAPMLTDPSRLCSAEYQAYAVLTMCRSLYTLTHADIVSKTIAAAWAKDFLGPRWADLVNQAERWRAGTSFDRLDEVLALIAETIRRVAESSSDSLQQRA